MHGDGDFVRKIFIDFSLFIHLYNIMTHNNPSKSCDRCNGELGSHFMSWFTEETICGFCHNKEVRFKMEFDRPNQGRGKTSAIFEDCGYIPVEFKEYLNSAIAA
jgi:hypothetical protein